MQRFWNRIADAYVHRPWAAAVIALCISLIAGFGLTQVSFDDSPHNIFRTEDEEFQFLNSVLEQYGADDNDCLLMVSPQGSTPIFSAAGLAQLRELAAEIEQVDGVQDVISLANPRVEQFLGLAGADSNRELTPADYTAAQDKALNNPLIHGQLLADDAAATLVIARLESERKNIAHFEQPVADLREIARTISAESPLLVEMTGIPPLRVEIFSAVQSENQKYMVIGSLLAFAMAFVLFRKLRLVMIASIGPILGSMWTIGMMALLGQKINVLNVVLPTLVIVVGFTSSIHLIIDARKSLAAGQTVRESVWLAISHLGGACSLAMLTTVVGFASLATSSAEILRMFGLACAGGVVCSFTSVILTVPLLMLWLLRDEGDSQQRKPNTRLGHAMEQLTSWIIARPRSIVIAGCMATLLPVALLPQLYPDTALTETIPEDRESFQTLQRCDETFGGVLSIMIAVDWTDDLTLTSQPVQSTLAEIETAIDETPPLRYPLSVRSLLRTIDPSNPDSFRAQLGLSLVPRETLDRMYRQEYPRRTIVTARLPDLGAAEYLKIISKFETRLEEIETQHPEISLRMTGTPILAARNINQMVVDLTKSLTLAAVVIFGVITVTFRSFKLGLLSLIPNSFPLVLTAAMLVIFGYPLQLASVIVFTICLGLAVDDTIHYLNRFKREFDAHGEVRTALRRASHSVGSALIVSTLVLLAGFGSVIASEIPTSRLFASLACTAMVAALLGDLLFLPALLAVFVKDSPKSGDTDHASTPSQLSRSG